MGPPEITFLFPSRALPVSSSGPAPGWLSFLQLDDLGLFQSLQRIETLLRDRYVLAQLFFARPAGLAFVGVSLRAEPRRGVDAILSIVLGAG